MSWRKCPFHRSEKYRVKKDVTRAFELNAGDILTYEDEAWSRIDGATVYFFSRVSDRLTFQWWLSDDDPLESWQQVFEKV